MARAHLSLDPSMARAHLSLDVALTLGLPCIVYGAQCTAYEHFMNVAMPTILWLRTS